MYVPLLWVQYSATVLSNRPVTDLTAWPSRAFFVYSARFAAMCAETSSRLRMDKPFFAKRYFAVRRTWLTPELLHKLPLTFQHHFYCFFSVLSWRASPIRDRAVCRRGRSGPQQPWPKQSMWSRQHTWKTPQIHGGSHITKLVSPVKYVIVSRRCTWKLEESKCYPGPQKQWSFTAS